MHGGKAKPGYTAPATPGSIYSKFLTEEERQAESAMAVGNLDDEIRLSRIRLMRVLREEMGGGDKDYDAIADKLLGRIQSLEKTRKEILGKDGDEDDLIDPNPDV